MAVQREFRDFTESGNHFRIRDVNSSVSRKDAGLARYGSFKQHRIAYRKDFAECFTNRELFPVLECYSLHGRNSSPHRLHSKSR